MSSRTLEAFACGAFALLSAICAEAAPMTAEPVFQSFQFGNRGQGVVQDVEILYGGRTLPRGVMNKTFKPSEWKLLSEAEVVPIPDEATIRWTSADGQHHQVVAPVRSFIKDAACFHGFQFVFIDDHVDIYLVQRKYDCTKILELEHTKVYPP